MNPLPSIASPNNISDLHTKSLSTTTHHRFVSLIGADPTIDTLASATTTATTAAPTVVASVTTATSDSVPTTVPTSDPTFVPTFIHPNPLPYLIDTGASYPIAPASTSDFAPFGLIRSTTSIAYSTKTSKVSSKVSSRPPVDPYTLITGEDTAIDLSSPDPFDSNSDSDPFDSDSEIASAFEVLEVREFGTATLIFILYPHSELKPTVLLEPIFDRFDWLDWVPLPRLTPIESYFHIFGCDYLQAFALFHLIPIWIALVSLIRSE